MIININPMLNAPNLIPMRYASPFPFGIQHSLSIMSFDEAIHFNLNQAKILLAGNTVEQKKLLSLLQSWNAEVDIVTDGLEMIEKVYLKKYDLIFIDLELSMMDGWQAAKLIRTRLKFSTPLIALLNAEQKIDESVLTTAGFNASLNKSIYYQSLYHILCKLGIGQDFSKQNKEATKFLTIDIDFIKKLANNDMVFVREIVRIFEEQTLEMIEQLTSLLTTHQTKNLNALVHKYKSSANSVGNKKVYQLCNEMEDKTRQKEPQWEEIQDQCGSLLPECQKILAEIPGILLKLEAA